ncbi:hypothetical protein [Methylobacterium oryzae]|uniref:hypothetical protein n=1 Tax=Methylobacterium oryzae TaxID=334852 RepID=UPI002F360906
MAEFVYTVQIGEKWVAATNSSPYFCLFAETEQEALARAQAAFAFTARARELGRNRIREREETPPVWHRTSTRELQVA